MTSSARSRSIGFDAPQNAAQVRINLIGRYFMQWAPSTLRTIFKNQWEEKLAYLDLSACQGGDEPEHWVSAALLPWANRQRNLRTQLFTLLNEKDEVQVSNLRTYLQAPGQTDRLAFEPQFYHSTVDSTVRNAVATVRSLPTFAILDAWHYEGVTWEWLYELIQQHRADCVLTLDLSLLLKHFNSKKQTPRLIRLLGEQGLTTLRQAFKAKRHSHAEKITAIERLLEIHLQETLDDLPQGGYLRFEFCDTRERPTQWLFFLTPHDQAYTTMRTLFTEESQLLEDGVGNLRYVEGQPTRQPIQCPTLFGPLFELQQELLRTYQNQTMQFMDLYAMHHRKRSFIRKNYLDALLALEEQGAIKITRERPGRGRKFPKAHLTNKAFISFKTP